MVISKEVQTLQPISQEQDVLKLKKRKKKKERKIQMGRKRKEKELPEI